jgi:hypothetical protein
MQGGVLALATFSPQCPESLKNKDPEKKNKKKKSIKIKMH